jgi:hypothetical protein
LLESASVSNSAATAKTSAADTASSLLRSARLCGVRPKLVEACNPDHLQPLSFPLMRSPFVYLRKLSFRSVVATLGTTYSPKVGQLSIGSGL